MKGFTLIELMVVIGITILLSGGGLAAYNSLNQRQLVRRAGSAITDLLRLAQTKTLTGEKPTGGACATASFDGYRVRVSGSQVILEAVCGGSSVDVGKNYTVGSGVSITSGQQVLFKVLAQGTTVQTFCLSGYGLKYRIKVLGSGEVVEDGFVATCP